MTKPPDIFNLLKKHRVPTFKFPSASFVTPDEWPEIHLNFVENEFDPDTVPYLEMLLTMSITKIAVIYDDPLPAVKILLPDLKILLAVKIPRKEASRV